MELTLNSYRWILKMLATQNVLKSNEALDDNMINKDIRSSVTK